MTLKTCKSCGRQFHPHPQTPEQAFCSSPDCQRERRRLAQQKRRKANAENQQKDICAPEKRSSQDLNYWKQYRKDHPDYAEQNRLLQKIRKKSLFSEAIANEAVSRPFFSLPSGRYLIIPVTSQKIASEAAWIVEITFLSKI